MSLDLAAIYQASPVPLCVLDRELRYVHVSDSLAAINGLSVKEHLGRRIASILPDIAAGVAEEMRWVLDTGEPIIRGIVEAETPALPSETRRFRHSFYPVKDGEEIVGLNCVVADITDKHQKNMCRAASDLTDRQRDVLRMLARGHGMKAISTELKISIGTVAYHKNTIMRRYGLKRKPDIVKFAIQVGLLTP